MSSKNAGILIIFFAVSLMQWPLSGKLCAQSHDDKALAADKAYGEKRFMDAMKIYDSLYSEGQYSELMLYRMAYILEETQNYPLAIYFLKKAAMEFGNPAIDAKVKQVMQLQGSDRFFPTSAWNTYLQFFRNWGWLIWTFFFLAVGTVVAAPWLKFHRGAPWRKATVAGAWTLVVLLGVVLGHRSFLVPDLAVLIEPTSFYDVPSYAGKQVPKAFSPGETLSIHDEQDIWVYVQAGDRSFWVPKRTVKML